MAIFKALLVGAGGMGKTWAHNLLQVPNQVEIVGWVDLREDASAEAAHELQLPTTGYFGTDLGKALADTSPDFVVDVTVPEAHCEITLQSLASGVPVLGEKPMADSMENARRMVAASEKSGKLYMVSQSRRYDNNLHAYRGLIETRIGNLGMLDSDFYMGCHFGGFRDEMRSPLILDMAIHTFDAARFLCGADPVAVYCEEFNPTWSWYRGAASAVAIFEMQNGIRYTYRGSWCAEGLPTSWEAEWRAVGSNGTAAWDGVFDHQPCAAVPTGDGFIREASTIVAEVASDPTGIAGSVQDFLRALQTGKVPMGECHDNIKSLAMVFAAMESSDSKQRIPVRF